MTKKYLLDTNIVSLIIRGNEKTLKELIKHPIGNIYISSITEAEIHYGLAKRPLATQLKIKVEEFLKRVDCLSFNQSSAIEYGKLRASQEKSGITLSDLDMLIAAHAKAEQMVLVTNDNAFKQLKHLKIETWS